MSAHLKTLVLPALLLAVPAAAEQAEAVERQVETAPDARPRVAPKLKTVVLGLEGRRGIDAGLAEALTDIVQGVYARDPGRVVLGRADLSRVLGFEETKQALGCTDDSCLSEIASALDADRLVTGSLDRIGATYLFVLSEIDARTLTPVGRVEHQFPVEEAMLVSAIREATEEFLDVRGQPTEPGAALTEPPIDAADDEVAAGDEGEVPFFHWLLATGKLTTGGLLAVLGAGFIGGGIIAIGVNSNGDWVGPGNTEDPQEDAVYSTTICFLPGGVCCAAGAGLLAWSAADFLWPPREASAEPPVEPTAGQGAALAAPPPPVRTVAADVMAH